MYMYVYVYVNVHVYVYVDVCMYHACMHMYVDMLQDRLGCWAGSFGVG